MPSVPPDTKRSGRRVGMSVGTVVRERDSQDNSCASHSGAARRLALDHDESTHYKCEVPGFERNK
jgi:hypothetical protein